MMILRLLLIFMLVNIVAISQDLFDPYKAHTLDIQFYNPDYDQILQERWEIDNKTYELATVIFNGDTLDSVGVRYKGNSTFWWTQVLGSPKFPLNIEFDLVYDDQDILGYDKLKLSNSIFDPTFVKETLGYLTESFYLPTPETGYATVSINGEYLGLYITVESINRSFLTKHFGNNEGSFFKCEPQFLYGEQYNAEPNLVWYGSDSMEYAYQMGYELKSDTGWDDLLNLIYTLNFNIDSIETVLNVDRVLWFFASTVVMPDLDTYTGMFIHNYYLYKNSNSGQFEIIPWDKDQTFGGAMINTLVQWGGDVSWVNEWDPFLFAEDENRPLFSKLMSVPLYKDIYTAHMRTIIDQIYNVEYMQGLAYEVQDSIESYANSYPNIFPAFNVSDYFRYNVDNHLVTFDGAQWCGVTSTVSSRLEFLAGHNEISKTAPEILNVFQANSSPDPGEDVTILAAVTGAEIVELMVSAGEENFIPVPMVDDGQHNDNDSNDNVYGAIVPFSLNGQHVKYYVRARNDEALALDPEQAEWDFYHYVIGDQLIPDSTIVINEINYNSSDQYDVGDWIELYNPTSETIDLGYWFFKDEDDDHIFQIPDNISLGTGEYIILSNDTSSFSTFFPEINNVLGDIGFGFSGGGELLRLYRSDSVLIDTVLYDDSSPWPEEPDGNGPTLELIHSSQDNAIAENWAASSDYGTPGTVNSVSLRSEYKPSLPTQFQVFNNYPNPFNPYTTLNYELVIDQHINISIFDMLGRKIKTLVNELQSAGKKSINWQATNDQGRPIAGGVYICSIKAGESVKSIKMVYLK